MYKILFTLIIISANLEAAKIYFKNGTIVDATELNINGRNLEYKQTRASAKSSKALSNIAGIDSTRPRILSTLENEKSLTKKKMEVYKKNIPAYSGWQIYMYQLFALNLYLNGKYQDALKELMKASDSVPKGAKAERKKDELKTYYIKGMIYSAMKATAKSKKLFQDARTFSKANNIKLLEYQKIAESFEEKDSHNKNILLLKAKYLYNKSNLLDLILIKELNKVSSSK